MTGKRTRPAGEDSRQAPTLPREALVANRVHTTMEAVQAAGVGGVGNRVARVAELFELPGGNDPMLLPCKARQRLMRSLLVVHLHTRSERRQLSPYSRLIITCLISV